MKSSRRILVTSGRPIYQRRVHHSSVGRAVMPLRLTLPPRLCDRRLILMAFGLTPVVLDRRIDRRP
jgi:hypothetical protein